MLKTSTISFEDFIEKTNALEDLLDSYIYGGYTEKQWEQKPLTDSIRKTEIHKHLRELRSYIEDDSIDYSTSDISEEDYEEFEEKLSEIFRRAEDYIYEN